MSCVCVPKKKVDNWAGEEVAKKPKPKPKQKTTVEGMEEGIHCCPLASMGTCTHKCTYTEIRSHHGYREDGIICQAD